MTSSSTQFKIQQLRTKSLLKTLESIAVFMFSLFLTLFLPNILVRYVYAGQQLFEQPAILEYLPMITFAIGVAYFLYAMVTNLMREMAAQKLEKEVESMVGCDCDDCDDHHHMPMMTMEKAGTVSDLSSALKKSSKGRKIKK